MKTKSNWKTITLLFALRENSCQSYDRISCWASRTTAKINVSLYKFLTPYTYCNRHFILKVRFSITL